MKNGSHGRRRSIAEVRASLERSSQDLRAALQRLERGARAKVDIGRYVAGKASTILVVGFVAGMLLGMAGARRRRLRLVWR